MFHPAPFFTSTSQSIPQVQLTKKKATLKSPGISLTPAKTGSLTPSASELEPYYSPGSPQQPITPSYPSTPSLGGSLSTSNSFRSARAVAPLTPTSIRVALPHIEPLGPEPITVTPTYQDSVSEQHFEQDLKSPASSQIPDSESLISELFDILGDPQYQSSSVSQGPQTPQTPYPAYPGLYHIREPVTEKLNYFSSQHLDSNLSSPTSKSFARSYEQLMEDHLLETIRQSNPHTTQDSFLGYIVVPEHQARKREISDLSCSPAHYVRSSASGSALETQPGPRKPLARRIKTQFSTIFKDTKSDL